MCEEGGKGEKKEEPGHVYGMSMETPWENQWNDDNLLKMIKMSKTTSIKAMNFQSRIKVRRMTPKKCDKIV